MDQPRIDNIMALAAAYAEAEGIDGPDPIYGDQYPYAQLGRRVAGGSGVFQMLQNGALDEYLIAEIESWFSAFWPDDLEWPAGIDRAPPSAMHAHQANMKREQQRFGVANAADGSHLVVREAFRAHNGDPGGEPVDLVKGAKLKVIVRRPDSIAAETTVAPLARVDILPEQYGNLVPAS